MSVIGFDGVSFTYPGGVAPALRDVTVTIEPGELVVVAGGSGSGKSTLLRAISGLVPHFHGGTFAGRVSVAGLDTREHRPAELATVVGTLFQDPESQIVMGTVRAELAFGLENRGRAAAAVARGVQEVALALGIAHLLDRSTAELSGGELQRVALGAALAGRPSVVVLDEPTSQLDPVAGDELIGSLRRANEDSGATIVLAEHRLERCLGLADRVIALDAGRIVCDGTPAEFLAWAGRDHPYLQTPGARLLTSLRLTPAPGVKGARAALRAHGLLPEPDTADSADSADSGDARDAGDVGDVGGAVAGAAGHRRPGAGRRRRRLRAGPGTGVPPALAPPAAGPGTGGPPALALDHVWHELRAGPVILRDVSLALAPGERVALMGANGAGKSTLLRHAAGLMTPTRGRIAAAGRVALLAQNPNDYLVHETVAGEASAAALERVGLASPALRARHPRDLSGGERQLLALAVVLGGPDDRPAAVCLDEPTRGMDRQHKQRLAALLTSIGAAVIVATHDPEFAVAFAERVVLLADGATIADATTRAVLAGGRYFATETARILGGAGGALTPEEGAALLAQPAVAAAGAPSADAPSPGASGPAVMA